MPDLQGGPSGSLSLTSEVKDRRHQPDRLGVIGLELGRIATDWEKHPPRLVWRHRVGPGWSSFAVVGTRLYTQEQRGEEEVVVCYDTASGGELWAQRCASSRKVTGRRG